MSIVAYGYGIDGTAATSRVVRNAVIELNTTTPTVTLVPRGVDVSLTVAPNLIVLSNEHVAFLEAGEQIAATIRQFELTLTSRSFT